MQRHEHRQTAYAINKYNRAGWAALAVIAAAYMLMGVMQ